MNYKQFEEINHNVSSEMFYSLMAVLHERLPCSHMYFKMRREYKEKLHKSGKYTSPVRRIASPNMIKGLSPKVKRESNKNIENYNLNPDVRIKNRVQSPKRRPTAKKSSKTTGLKDIVRIDNVAKDIKNLNLD